MEIQNSYDNSKLVTVSDFSAMLPEYIEGNKAVANSLVKGFNLPIKGQYRAEGAKGKGANLYRLTDIQKLLFLIDSFSSIEKIKVNNGNVYQFKE